MIATTYKLENILDHCIRGFLVQFATELTNFHVRTKSIYIIGSSVDHILKGNKFLITDIDLAVIPEKDFVRGERIYTKFELTQLSEIENPKSVKTGISYNGIPVIEAEGLHIDLIPIEPSDISEGHAQVKIDICSRSNIHVSGVPIFERKMNPELTLADKVNRVKIAENYIDREIHNDLTHFMRYIEKSFWFSFNLINLNPCLPTHSELKPLYNLL